MPEVSVIIPCYNHAPYLPCAVRSILAQTFADWEAIIVDDGSTDNTREVSQQYADPRIRYVYQENRGLSAARNTGIHAAQGQYLAFLDADDEWEPRFLEVCRDQLDAQQTTAAVVALARFIDENGAEMPRLGGQVVSCQEFRARLIEGGFFPVHAALVRSETVRRAGMFDETLTSVEDWDLWLRITASGAMMMCIPEPLARYRVSSGSMSTNAGRMHDNRIAVLTKYFGAPEGEPAAWSDEKRRAYAFAYRTSALGYLQQQEPDVAWLWLRDAAQVWPQILARLDTLYELACGDQPRGYRGDAKSLDIAARGAEMLRRLNALFACVDERVRGQRRAAYSNAYLALGMLSEQAGDWVAARHNILKAVQAHPSLAREPGVLRRLGKLMAGQDLANLARHALGHPNPDQRPAPTESR